MKVKIIKVSSAAILLGALRVNVRAVTRHSAVTDCSGFIKYHYYNCFTFAGKQSVIIFNYRCVFKSFFFLSILFNNTSAYVTKQAKLI